MMALSRLRLRGLRLRKGDAQRSLFLLNVMIFMGYMTVGLPLPVLPLFAATRFDANALLIGVLVGCQSLSTVLTRPIAGHFVDLRGPKTAVILGLLLCAATGALYIASCIAPAGLALLVLGRLTLGFAESLILTGAITWGIGRLGPAHSGQVMSRNGIALYGALAASAPIGLFVYQKFGENTSGFIALGALASFLPLCALLLAISLQGAAFGFGARARAHHLLRSIWPLGLALMLLMATYGAMASFYSLLFDSMGWNGAAFGFFVFGAMLIVVRLFLSRAPDRFGGATVAFGSIAAACLGQVLIFSASNPAAAILGAGITGGGVALGFPALGIEAMKRSTEGSRGMMIALFSAFQDLSLGVAGPLAGLLMIAFKGGPRIAFGMGCASALFAMLILTTMTWKKG